MAQLYVVKHKNPGISFVEASFGNICSFLIFYKLLLKNLQKSRTLNCVGIL